MTCKEVKRVTRPGTNTGTIYIVVIKLALLVWDGMRSHVYTHTETETSRKLKLYRDKP